MKATTAFGETAEHVRGLVREMEIDEEALSQPIARCDLARCGGTCCHDGVYLNSDEARILRGLVVDHASEFERFGVELPERPIVYGKSETTSGPKTATKPVAMAERVSDYPAHFAQTNCVFLADDGRCALQRLAESQNLHPWHFKPFTCWMHPLSIDQSQSGTPVLTLHNRESDPQNLPGYPGFVSQTHCGRIAPCGKPAREVLAPELEMLGQIAGREL
tara:strand:- start:6236 stop:6892 length:657 start_codon:yes stop_codon:yes gene_type:complete